MNAPAISFFERLYLPPSKAYTLEEIIILIRSRRWEYLIVAYRAALSAGDREGAREQKKQLPGFTPSGTLQGRPPGLTSWKLTRRSQDSISTM